MLGNLTAIEWNNISKILPPKEIRVLIYNGEDIEIAMYMQDGNFVNDRSERFDAHYVKYWAFLPMTPKL
jgi:hypothetical protein